MKRILGLLVALTLGTLAVTAADLENLGPAVGTKIPHDLSSVDSAGAPQSFDSLKGEKGAVVVFFRSAKWCPFCQGQLISLETIAEDIRGKGFNLIAISYDPIEELAKFKTRRDISYPLLSDKDSEIIDAFDIRNEKFKPGHYAYGVPHPLIAFVDTDGVIKAKLYEESFKNRPELENILKTLDEI